LDQGENFIEIQWFKYHLGGTIAAGFFELVTHLSVPSQ